MSAPVPEQPGPELQILGFGAQSALGATVAATAAAFRAGIASFTSYQLPGPYNTRIEARVARIPWVTTADPAERLASFGEAALRQALAPLEPPRPRAALQLFWALPAERPDLPAERLREKLSQSLLESRDERLRQAAEGGELRLFCSGHAAGVAALAAAREAVAAEPHKLCLLCGSDSYLGHESLCRLRDAKRLRAKTRRSGFVAGEAGAALLLGSPEAAAELGLTPLAAVQGIGLSHEPKHLLTDEICLGEGLTRAFREALDGGEAQIDMVLADTNGERFRAEELGYALLRSAGRLREPGRFQSPASFLGDVGAAWVPLGAALCLQALQRGWAEGPRALISASSDEGARGVVVLGPPCGAGQEDSSGGR